MATYLKLEWRSLHITSYNEARRDGCRKRGWTIGEFWKGKEKMVGEMKMLPTMLCRFTACMYGWERKID